MTEQNSPYVPPTPPAPYQAPKKPPLSPELKRAASVAGAVSFTVMTIGWSLLATAVGIGLFASLFTWVLGTISASGEGRGADYSRMMDFIESLNPGAWVIPLVIAALVGLGLWVWSLFISRGMLARAKHPSPWAVTWAGAGIAIAASWFLSWIAWLPLQLLGMIQPDAFNSVESGLGFAIVFGVVSFVLGLAVAAVIGWFAWWWMAHAMRPAAPAAMA